MLAVGNDMQLLAAGIRYATVTQAHTVIFSCTVKN